MDTRTHLENQVWAARMEEYFQALGDRTRLRILNLLSAFAEVCVGDLVRVIGPNQPKISRHLAYLRRRGLIDMRKDGLKVHYRLARPEDEHHRRILESLLSSYREVDELRREIEMLEIVRSETAGGDRRAEDATDYRSFEQTPIEIELL